MLARAVLVGVALGAFLIAPAAEAKKKKVKVAPIIVATGSATSTVDDQAIVATATCPKGKIAVGGGFSSERFPPSGALSDLNIIYESRRTSERSWNVLAVREDASSSGPALTVTASVYCRTPKLKPKGSAKAVAAKTKQKKKKKKLVITQASATSPALGAMNSVQTATAACPGNQKVLSGGFSSAPPPELGGSNSIPVIWQSYANAPHSWITSATQGGAVVPHTVTSYAYCARKANTTSVSGTAQLAGAAAGNFPSGSATTGPCPKARRLVGGGFNHPQVALPGGPVFYITESRATASRWTAGAVNALPPPIQLAAVGGCFK